MLQGQVGGERVAVADRRDREVGACAGLGHADRVPPLAEVAPADRAVVALAAEQRRVDGHPVADRELGDTAPPTATTVPANSCPGMTGYGGRRELAVHDVDVGAADADRGHGDDDLAGPGRRIVRGADVDLARFFDDHRAHCLLNLFGLLLHRAQRQAAHQPLLGDPAGEDHRQHGHGRRRRTAAPRTVPRW